MRSLLTHQRREPWPRPGGTTFHFVNDGIESALRHAREAAGPRDVRIGGGASAIQQYLNAGLVDDLWVTVSPVFFGAGIRLFEGIDPRLRIDLVEAVPSPQVTHLRYALRRS